jgi:hypothetical protein
LDQFNERQAELAAQYQRLSNNAGPEVKKDEWEERETGKTRFEHWESLDTAGRREWLREHDVTMRVGKNDGNVYAIVDGRSGFHLLDLDVFGNPPGLTLMERAKAKGLDKIVDAEAAADDWQPSEAR